MFHFICTKIDGVKLPTAVKASFAKQYPMITITLVKEGGKYETGFKKYENTIQWVLCLKRMAL